MKEDSVKTLRQRKPTVKSVKTVKRQYKDNVKTVRRQREDNEKTA